MNPLTEYQVVLQNEDRVELLRSGSIVAIGRWTGRAIVDCFPALAESPERTTVVMAMLARQLEEETSRAWQALPAACDERGVDLDLLDWMLSLSPAERLAVLQDAVDTFARDPSQELLGGDALP